MTTHLLDARGLSKIFATGGRRVVALEEVSLALSAGQTLGHEITG